MQLLYWLVTFPAVSRVVHAQAKHAAVTLTVWKKWTMTQKGQHEMKRYEFFFYGHQAPVADQTLSTSVPVSFLHLVIIQTNGQFFAFSYNMNPIVLQPGCTSEPWSSGWWHTRKSAGIPACKLLEQWLFSHLLLMLCAACTHTDKEKWQLFGRFSEHKLPEMEHPSCSACTLTN